MLLCLLRRGCCSSAAQISLAYLTAATHGLEEDAGRLRELLEAQGIPIPEVTYVAISAYRV